MKKKNHIQERATIFLLVFLKEVLSKNGFGYLYVTESLWITQELMCAKGLAYGYCQKKAISA